MLPSFRLIAATFLCGFFVVFAGLRMAISLNDIHEGLPVMMAHATPGSIAPMADRELRRGQLAASVMYDLRFAVSPISPTLVNAAPLSLVPPEVVAKTASDGEASLTTNPMTRETFSAIEPAVSAADPLTAPAPDSPADDRQP